MHVKNPNPSVIPTSAPERSGVQSVSQPTQAGSASPVAVRASVASADAFVAQQAQTLSGGVTPRHPAEQHVTTRTDPVSVNPASSVGSQPGWEALVTAYRDFIEAAISGGTAKQLPGIPEGLDRSKFFMELTMESRDGFHGNAKLYKVNDDLIYRYSSGWTETWFSLADVSLLDAHAPAPG
jgi:hypothetical protein